MANLQKPQHSESDWDVPLNETLDALDARIDDASTSLQNGLAARPTNRLVPSGGGTGFSLGKKSSNDFDLVWLPNSITTSPAMRASATQTITTSLAAGARWAGLLQMAFGYRIYSVTASSPARVQLYTTAAARDRATTAGLVLDVDLTTAALSLSPSPQIQGANLEATPSALVPLAITNISNAAVTNLTITITYVDTEVVTDSAHAALSADVHGVKGTVVGTSDSQTLSNKTISGGNFTGSSTFAGPTALNGATTIKGTNSLQGNTTVSGQFVSQTLVRAPNVPIFDSEGNAVSDLSGAGTAIQQDASVPPLILAGVKTVSFDSNGNGSFQFARPFPHGVITAQITPVDSYTLRLTAASGEQFGVSKTLVRLAGGPPNGQTSFHYFILGW